MSDSLKAKDVTVVITMGGDGAAVFDKDGDRVAVGHLDDVMERLLSMLNIRVEYVDLNRFETHAENKGWARVAGNLKDMDL